MLLMNSNSIQSALIKMIIGIEVALMRIRIGKNHRHLAMMTEMISDHLVLIETMMIGLHHHLVMMMMTMIGIEIDLRVMTVTIEMTAMMIATKIMIKAISQLQY